MDLRARLILVSGAPGSGKTALSDALARALDLPVFPHDDVRTGLAATDRPIDSIGVRALGPRVWDTYYTLLARLTADGVSLIADAHFHRGVSEAPLAPAVAVSRAVLVHCSATPAVVLQRMRERHEPPHSSWFALGSAGVLRRMEEGDFEWEAHVDPMQLQVPTLTVDTTDGYVPTLDEIIAFVGDGS